MNKYPSIPTLLIVLCFLLLSACSKNVPQLSKLQANAVVLAFGDSLTYGTGATAEASYPSVLGERIGHTIINAGIPGELSADGLKRLPTLLEEHQPALLILCHGGNDMLRKQPMNHLEKNLVEMINLARANGTEVVLVGVPEPKIMLLDDAPLYKKVAKAFQLPYVEGALASILSDSDLKSDGVHPNANGYQQLAEFIQITLSEAQAI